MKMVQLLKQIDYISERGVGACEAMGVARADTAWLFGRGFGAGCKICTL